MSGEATKKARRGYRPEVEGLESLRLFHAAMPDLAHLVADHAGIAPSTSSWPVEPGLATSDVAAWDTVLDARLSDLLSEPGLVVTDPEAVREGLNQLNRYLSRSWARAGLPEQKRDDCTQAVFVTLIEGMGRPRFDRLMTEIGHRGVREVLNRETAEGPDFFRAVDAVKKRAQRERVHGSLSDSRYDPPTVGGDGDWGRTLDEAIRQTLNPRETELIRATLAGDSPAEIADRWGVAAKTVSNEKTRVISKLREFLVSDLATCN